MKDKIGVFFTDNSDRELGYKLAQDDKVVGEIEIDEANEAFVESGNAELISDNTPKPSFVGEDYQININNAGRGTKQIKLINFNQSGQSTASLGAIDVYRRSKLYLYIGDEEVLGTGDLSDLHLYEGDSIDTLDKLMEDSFVKTHFESQPSIDTDWTETKAEDYGINDKFGAELSFSDCITANYQKPVAVWRLAVPNAIASTNYANNGNALQFIQNNISNNISELRNLFVQSRLSGVIVNMDNSDADVISSYQGIIDWLRSYFDFEDLPIVLTDRRGVRQEIKDSAYFKIEDRGDVIGDWYSARGLTGYYGIATSDFGGLKWNKLYNLDGSETTGSNYIRFNSGKYDDILRYYAFKDGDTGTFDSWRKIRQIYGQNSFYDIPYSNQLVGGRGVYGNDPRQFMYIESGDNVQKTFDEWMTYLKISSLDEWEEKFAGTGMNVDFMHIGTPAPNLVFGYYIFNTYKRPYLFDDPVRYWLAKSNQIINQNSDVVEIIPLGRSQIIRK